MLVGDHYYTASRHRNGFFAIDQSPFLQKEEIVQLDATCLYSPPSGLPGAPSDAEIASSFPVALCFYRLASGKYVYVHAAYIGRSNHSPDRYGNFFAHSVILKDQAPAFPAVLFFQQVKFKRSFSLEEDAKYTPHLAERELTIDKGSAQLQAVFNRWLGQAQNDPTFLPVLSQVFDLVASGYFLIRGKKLTICDTKERVSDLILAVNFLLPQSMANQLTFATYVSNPLSHPFQLSGVIPECEVANLDPSQCLLINAAKSPVHQPKQDYTKRLLAILKDSSGQAFDRWLALNKDVDEWSQGKAGLRLNAPAIFHDFLDGIRTRSLSDVDDMVRLELPASKLVEFRSAMLDHNPQLYLDYLSRELRTALVKAYTYKERCEAFLRLYTEHFAGHERFRREHLNSFAEIFREEMRGDKNAASVFILINCNCTDLLAQRWLVEKMHDADYWFDDDAVKIDEKLAAIIPLRERYRLDDPQFASIANIMRIKSLHEIHQAAEQGDLFKFVHKNRSLLQNLKDTQKVTAFVRALNSENRKGRFDLTFSKYLRIIQEFFPGRESEFWQIFFERNSYHPKDDFSKHSLDYLKRKFVVSIFMSEGHQFGVIEKLSLDVNSLRWIEEEIRETARKESIVNDFYTFFENHIPARTGGWLARMNPFKR